ncbi:MAG: hypothetical protein PUB98_02275 [Clostridiales bacterium]|nr:hypothetical protein [Clostridiales bacterium]
MIINRLQNPYKEQYQQLCSRKTVLEKHLNEIEKKSEQKAVVLELSGLEKEIEKKKAQMDQYTQYEMVLRELESAKQQGETARKMTDDTAKCMEIARRIANGDKVPAKDEQRLLEYNFKMYAAAKNMASLKRNEKPKKYDSLWEEDENKANAPLYKDSKINPTLTSTGTESAVTISLPPVP